MSRVLVAELEARRIDHIVLRPTGYFSDLGGPKTYTWNEVATLAFEALGSEARVSHVPRWVMEAMLHLVRLFNRHQGELLASFTTMATTDVVAPATGTRTLAEHFRALGGTK